MKVEILFLALYSVCVQSLEPGIPLQQQKSVASPYWKYQWGPPPYGSIYDIAGVLQIVNAGSEAMWIRYSGNGIDTSGPYYWKQFITRPSVLNGNTAHPWTQLGTHNMTGQGDGFKLNPGEYQIVPFAGRACWFGGSLGCCNNGNNCILSPNGRGSGQDASPPGQPNTLFEWTAPGLWDCSAVDGFSLPMTVQIDGCGAPFDGSPANCLGSEPIVGLNFSRKYCPNYVLTDGGTYVGCKSMCGCQYYAIDNQVSTDPACNQMRDVTSIRNQPYPPGGYCGCAQASCPDWLRNYFKQDIAGIKYCNAITQMAHNSTGHRSIYCQAYDDIAGLKSYGNGVIKVLVSNRDFEGIKDRKHVC